MNYFPMAAFGIDEIFELQAGLIWYFRTFELSQNSFVSMFLWSTIRSKTLKIYHMICVEQNDDDNIAGMHRACLAYGTTQFHVHENFHCSNIENYDEPLS